MPDRRLWFAAPGDLDAVTGGTLYDKRLIAELRQLGWTVTHLAWPDSFPLPEAEDLRLAAADLAGLPAGALVLIDGLAFGAMPGILSREAARLRLAALVHHPLALETGLPKDRRALFVRQEQRALSFARAVIVTSDTTAATLVRDYSVDPCRITVAKPGVDRPGVRQAARRSSNAVNLLSVGSVTPRKGFDILVDALARVTELKWSCTIAGSLRRAPATATALIEQVHRRRLGERIALIGETHPLAPFYENADVFVLPSRYEGYGMVFAEAMTYGLPIVATKAGAIPELVPPLAGILVPVDDPQALSMALRRMITDPGFRLQIAAGAQHAAATLPWWRDTAAKLASALSQIED